MSIKVMNAVWQDGPDDQTKLLLLLALADFADDAGACWPSMDTLAKKARTSVRSARRHLREMEAQGWVKVQINAGRSATNVFVVNAQSLPGSIEQNRDDLPRQLADYVRFRDAGICQYCEAPGSEIDHVIPRSQGGSNELENLVVACGTCNKSKGKRTPEQWFAPDAEKKPANLAAFLKTGQTGNENRPNEAQNRPNGALKPAIAVAAEPSRTIKEPSENHQRDFEEFWTIVPRKKGKGAARTAYDKALRKTDSATLFSAMSIYAESREGKDPQYTVHPTTWLNQERWLDEPDQKPRNFHDKLDEALNGLRKPDSIDFSEAQRLSAPVQDARSPDGRGGASAGEGNGGGNQQAVASVIRPRRFGGSAW